MLSLSVSRFARLSGLPELANGVAGQHVFHDSESANSPAGSGDHLARWAGQTGRFHDLSNFKWG